jgi:phospholipid/cholesterol/gamma-HCH transport system permease protein
VPVILIVATFTGMVLGLQGHYVLSRFGASSLLGTLVSLSLCRELAPVLAALMIAGQAGSSIAAELGMQRSTEQIDALDLIGVRAEGFLVGQRIFASLLSFPILTAAFVIVGTYGGYLAGCVLLPVPAPEFWSAVHEAVRPRDIAECLIKSLAFGLLCTTIACYSGFHAHLSGLSGARAVSLGTVRAVVASSIAVLATDYLITSLLV